MSVYGVRRQAKRDAALDRGSNSRTASYGPATRAGVVSRMARIRNGIGTAKAVPRPLALSPQSKGNSRDGRWRKTTKVAKSAKSEISGGASSVLPGLRIGIGQPNSPATDLPRGRAWFHGSRPLAESGRMGGEGVAKIQPFLCEPLWFSVVTGPRLWIGRASLTPSRQGAKGG